MGKIELHKVNAVAGVGRVTENTKKDIIICSRIQNNKVKELPNSVPESGCRHI